MGVIHKLTDQVIEFIVNAKTNDQSLSCRKLAAIVNEKFHLNVSKSSVNTVLKNSKLSSDVGRPSKIIPPKFQIPSSKKQEIAKNMSQLGINVQSEIQPVIIQPIRATHLKKTKSKKIIKQKGLPLIEDPLNQKQSPEKLKPIVFEKSLLDDDRIVQKNEHDETVAYAGAVILKYALMEISDKFFISEVIKKHTSFEFEEGFDRFCETLFFLRFFNLDGFSEHNAKTKSFFWRLCDFDPAQYAKVIPSWFNQLDRIENIESRYLTECQHSFTEIHAIKVTLQDGSFFLVDPCLKGFCQSKAPHAFFAPITKATTAMSKYLISNILTPCFFGTTEVGHFSKDFTNLVLSFQSAKGKEMEKVSLIDSLGESLAEFDIIPRKRRTFIFAVWPHQKEFKELMKTVKFATQNVYQGLLGQEIYFSAIQTNLFSDGIESQRNLRAIAVSAHPEANPEMIMISNHLMKTSNEMILDTFFTRWPSGMKQQLGLPEFVRNSPDTTEDKLQIHGINGFNEMTDDFALKLHSFVRYTYFCNEMSQLNINDCISNIYGALGKVHQANKKMVVHLQTPSGGCSKQQWEIIINHINMRRLSQKVNISSAIIT